MQHDSKTEVVDATEYVVTEEISEELSQINLVNGPLVVVDVRYLTIKEIDIMFLSQKMAESAVQHYGLDSVDDYVEMLALGLNFEVEETHVMCHEKFLDNN